MRRLLPLSLLALAACTGHVMNPRPEIIRFGPAAAGSAPQAAPTAGGVASGRPASARQPGVSPGSPWATKRIGSATLPGALEAQAGGTERGAAERAVANLGPTLAEVSATRGLAVLRPIEGKVVGRDAMIARVMSKVERDYPPGVLRAQGEVLAALGLVPPDYDYQAGMYGLLKSNVAGFYDPDDRAMVLLDDLDGQNIADTLAHELTHALQDQHYQLEPLLRYRPHDSDRVAAVQVLSEGDATSTMFDVVSGAGFDMPDGWMRLLLLGSTAFSEGGADVPRVLHLSLVASYVDGLALVRELRRKGGWPAVDQVWRRLPTTTEQVLHLDKYLANEPGIELPVPSLDALGLDWTTLDHDVLGEQGLRISLEKWTDRDTAARAAAGWGGDRYVVAIRPLGPPPMAASPASGGAPLRAALPAAAPAPGPVMAATGLPAGPSELVVAWVVRFDTPADARELAEVLRQGLGAECTERPRLGAMAWLARGDTVAIAAGPFQRDAQGARLPAPPSCVRTTAWARSLLAQKRPAAPGGGSSVPR
jgi:hypothetical protein